MGKHDRKEKTRKGDRDRDRDRDRSERGRGKKGGERWRKGATADADEAKFAASLASMRPPLCVKSIVGDGNCLFRSIADQLHGDESQHPRIRSEIVAHMQQKIDHYSLFIEDDEPADDYFARMASPCEWGGNLELYACCERYRVHVAVFQVDGPCFTLSPESVGTEAGGAGNGKAKPSRGHKSKLGAAEAASSSSSLRSIALSFHGECHYNSVRLSSDPGQPGEPAAEVRPPAPAPHVAAGTKAGVEAGQDVQEEGEEEENEEGEDNGGIAAEPGAEGQGEGEWGEAAPEANPSIDPDTEPGPDPGPDPGPVPDPGAAAERRAHRAQQKAERQREALKRMQKMAARALVMAAGFRLQQQAALSRKAARKAEKAQAKAEKARAEGGGGEGVGAGGAGAGQEGVGHLSESMATIAI